MIFTMNSQDLLEGLNTVTRALSARSPKQILEGILMTAAGDRVKMTCTDGSLVIECTNAASIIEEGQAVCRRCEYFRNGQSHSCDPLHEKSQQPCHYECRRIS